MQAERPSNRRFLWPGVALVGAILVIILSNGPQTTPEGVPIIRDRDEYQQVLERAQTLSLERLRALEAGQEPSEEDRKALREAAGLFQAMNRFAPTETGRYIGEAKCYLALGEHERAAEAATQAIENVPLVTDPERQKAVAASVIEAYYILSRALFARGDYKGALENANVAVEAVPTSPNYRTSRAAALIQLKRVDDAKADLGIALSLDPNHKLSRGLQKLLNASSDGPF